MVYALLKAVHVLAVVLWVGGMAFASSCVRRWPRWSRRSDCA